ncbi:MAG: hypothetical protein GY828_03240 [Candidatus Gracilibacteria bacterium]|nr:hypothetical protein [Candidatus Gracilibacteria bacterium]
MNKQSVFISTGVISILVLSFFYFTEGKNAQIEQQKPVIEQPTQQTSKTLQHENKTEEIKKILPVVKNNNFSEKAIAEFGLHHALDYFKRDERFDHEGVEVDRVIHINVDEACGGPDKLVLLKKNGLYAGMAKVNIEQGEMRIGQHGPGNYADRSFDGVHIEKPYITLEEAIEQVAELREGLTFKDYMNTCFDGNIGSYSHMPYFRFVDETGEEFLYNIDGEYKHLTNHKNLKKQMEAYLAEPEDPIRDKADYTDEQVSEFFKSDIPEMRLKVISSYNSEKIYQLVYDQNSEVQRSAFLEIFDHSAPSGNPYLEDYYTDMLSANLSYEALLELQGYDFEQFNNLSKTDFINYLKDSSSFVNLTEEQQNEILINL